MPTLNFNVSPKYKKSFIEFNYLEKKIDDKIIKIVQEIVWRSGEINVMIDENKVKEFNNIEELFNSIKINECLIFNEDFPFEYEFDSSWDGCSTDYNITYDDGSDVEEEIMTIIEEEGFYDLEDYYGYQMVDTKYEIDGELEIKQIE